MKNLVYEPLVDDPGESDEPPPNPDSSLYPFPSTDLPPGIGDDHHDTIDSVDYEFPDHDSFTSHVSETSWWITPSPNPEESP